MKEVKRGTYLVTFKSGEKVIFGNNYKPWWQHAVEFTYRAFGDSKLGWRYDTIAGVVTKVEYSNQQFYDDGGLKWCHLKAYQGVIDETSVKDGLVPIKATDIVFRDSPADKATLTKQLKKW